MREGRFFSTPLRKVDRRKNFERIPTLSFVDRRPLVTPDAYNRLISGKNFG